MRGRWWDRVWVLARKASSAWVGSHERAGAMASPPAHHPGLRRALVNTATTSSMSPVHGAAGTVFNTICTNRLFFLIIIFW